MPSPPSSPPDHSVTLSGSSELVTEFFAYSVNTLLYQRGIYPPESFTRVSKYGMTMLVSTDAAVQKYLDSVLKQMHAWLQTRQLDRVAVVVASVATKMPLERWVFNVRVGDGGGDENEPGNGEGKGAKKVMAEIQALVRQITASVTFLPLLDEPCTFDMLIYTKKDAETPALWEESGPRIIENKHEVQLRSFSTSVHNVDACVAFAKDDE